MLNALDPEHGVTLDRVRPFLREGFPWHTPDVPHPELGDPDRWWNNLEPVFVRAYEGAGCPRSLAREAAARVRQRYVDLSTYTLFDDALPTLRALSELGFRQRLITNHVPELASILDPLGLTPPIEHATSSAEVGYEKPHPAIYRLALQAAGNPRQAWMVGDNVEADVLGAERVGLRGILVRREDPRAKRFCPSLAGVVSLIAADRDAAYPNS